MFESEIKIEVERRLQAACDDRARAGLPPPVSVDALRAIVRSDLLAEIEARRVAQKDAVTPKPTPVAPKPAVVSLPTPTRQAPTAPAPKPRTPPKATGMALLIEMAEQSDRIEPVLPSLRNPPRAPARKPSDDPDEMAARAILAAMNVAKGTAS